MWRRLLSMLGFGWYIPTSSDFGDSGVSAPETGGQANVSFISGRQVSMGEPESEETLEARRKGLTDDSLVWPGKTESITVQNTEQAEFRYRVSVSASIDRAYYIAMPPTGQGRIQGDGSVLLRPGEEATFDVRFVPPPNMERAAPCIFEFTITRFDPNRAQDVGEILGEIPLRWVPLPSDSDLRIAATPPQVITRPWRRDALFHLEFLNKSLLPPGVKLDIQRAVTKEQLEAQPETVGTVTHPLPARTPGVWHCTVPAPAARGSYWVTVAGAAQVADNRSHPLRLAKPIFVKYIPWLRLPKDWLFLFLGLFSLLWIVWGIPWKRTPVVHMHIANPLSGTDWEKMDFKATTLEGEEAKVTNEGSGNYKIELPSRWAGNRWPWPGWNGAGRHPGSFKLKFIPPEKDADRYARLRPDVLTEKDKKEFALPETDNWNFEEVRGQLDIEPGFFITLKLAQMGALKRGDFIKVDFLAGGKTDTRKFLVEGAGATLIENYDLGIKDIAQEQVVSITASREDGTVLSTPLSEKLKASRGVVELALRFSHEVLQTPEQKKAAHDKQEQERKDKAAAAANAAPKPPTPIPPGGRKGNTGNSVGGNGGVERPKPPPKSPAQLKAEMLQAFKDFVHDQAANDQANTNLAQSALTAAANYRQAQPDDPLAQGLIAYTRIQANPKDGTLSSEVDKTTGGVMFFISQMVLEMPPANGRRSSFATAQEGMRYVESAIEKETDPTVKAIAYYQLGRWCSLRGESSKASTYDREANRLDPRAVPKD